MCSSDLPAYYQVDVKLAYTKTPEELARVISVTGSSAVSRELEELLKDRPEQVVFRISYFTAGESEETLRQAAEEAYAGQTVPLPPLEDVQITLYPAAGPQRVAEITLVWGEENLEENQGTALDTEAET